MKHLFTVTGKAAGLPFMLACVTFCTYSDLLCYVKMITKIDHHEEGFIHNDSHINALINQSMRSMMNVASLVSTHAACFRCTS